MPVPRLEQTENSTIETENYHAKHRLYNQSGDSSGAG